MSIDCVRLRKLLPQAKVSADFVERYIGAYGQLSGKRMELDVVQAEKLLAIFTPIEVVSMMLGV